MLLAAFIWYTLASLATYVAFWLDKRAAKNGSRRTPEKVLLTMAAVGGFPGALAAMWWGVPRLGGIGGRHKNRKLGFVVLVLLGALAHAVAWGWWVVG
jgi:uncharacterized membrane protein YsdA (DUF1294 family)